MKKQSGQESNKSYQVSKEKNQFYKNTDILSLFTQAGVRVQPTPNCPECKSVKVKNYKVDGSTSYYLCLHCLKQFTVKRLNLEIKKD